MHETFRRIAFADADRAEQLLTDILSPDRPGLAEKLSDALAETAQPDAVLVRLARYLEASVSRTADLELMAATPHHARVLVTLLGQSHHLTDIVCRNPEFVPWLWGEADLSCAATRDKLFEELQTQIRAFDSFEKRCASLRRFKRREFLRIAARDLFAHASLRSVTEDLSNLADACIEAALECAARDLLARFGLPRNENRYKEEQAAFCVVAMGKLGARELNFSSDIDLIFVYSEEGETSGGTSSSIRNTAFFQRLGERLIKALSERTTEGYVFRVDMRLRPHGRSGPLAVGLEAAVAYYESVGQAWERQALIKARPAAGSLALGDHFLERTRPFVFPRYFDDETLEEIRDVKQQMEAQVAHRGRTETEVKLGRGGIRDIEFTVQMLQLLNGGRIPELRVANTLDAIGALGAHGFLRPFEADTLAANYVFLRTVEHRLQIKGSQQIHTLPEAPAEIDEFARQLGYASGTSFLADYRDRTEANRAILERFLATEGSGTRWIYDVLHPQHDGGTGLARLAELGFSSPERAREELIRLYAGPEERPHTLRVRQQFTAIAPTLLEAVVSHGDPDTTLMRIQQILSNMAGAGTLYDVLKTSPQLCEYLVGLIANSEYLTNILLRDPGLFDTFGERGALDRPPTREELEEELAALLETREPEAAVYRLHAAHSLHTGLRDLFRGIDVFQVGKELTLLAEVCLNYALNKARSSVIERYGAAESPFAILGLGKLGGGELGYGSDLDLVFVYDARASTPPGVSHAEYYAAAASQTLTILKEPTRYGTLYDVDVRLRPHGKKGILAVSSAALEDYYLNEAQAWERLALVKGRAVAGDESLRRRVDRQAREFAFTKPLTRADVEQVTDIRSRLAEDASPLDLKKAEGGLLDIEFLVRLLQMYHAHRNPHVRCGDVAGAVESLRAIEALPDEAAQTLLDAYTFFRRVENRIRMAKGSSGSALPETPRARADLAGRLGIKGDLLEIVGATKTKVRALYQSTVNGPLLSLDPC